LEGTPPNQKEGTHKELSLARKEDMGLNLKGHPREWKKLKGTSLKLEKGPNQAYQVLNLGRKDLEPIPKWSLKIKAWKKNRPRVKVQPMFWPNNGTQ